MLIEGDAVSVFGSCVMCNQEDKIRLMCLKTNQSFSLLQLNFYPNLPLNFISDIRMQFTVRVRLSAHSSPQDCWSDKRNVWISESPHYTWYQDGSRSEHVDYETVLKTG